MKYKTFTYQIPPPEVLDDLNGFLSSNRILSVQSHIVGKNKNPYLIFIVEFLDSKTNKNQKISKIDYREKLSQEDFVLFSQLRDLRKSLADQEGVPVYALFTNAQLAEMVKKRIDNEHDFLLIEGVGKSKFEKYKQPFLAFCKELFKKEEKK